nr:PREDICTED: uncharacterized protein LOC107398878 isoform X2 [Tribolium castaneum]|eukprot:XP_015839918.1 PREDICTED: uncharacterized protein LOC107398878 isoform X2 [Tribolium castaneum]
MDPNKWTVVAFLEENKELEYSVVPLQWIYEIQDEQYCFWPPSHQRKHIEKATPYKTDWNPYKIHVFLQHGVTYADAMSYEQKLVAESTNSETEPLKVAGRKRKPTAALADYVLESCSSEDSSYIPPLPKMSHQSNISDDTLSMTSSELMPPPEVPLIKSKLKPAIEASEEIIDEERAAEAIDEQETRN